MPRLDSSHHSRQILNDRLSASAGGLLFSINPVSKQRMLLV
jgi:hypothetical protein